MLITAKYIILTAVRDWLFPGIFLALTAGFLLAAFLGDNALVEPEQMKIVYVAGISRIILNVGLIVFVCFHVRRMFESREIEVFLSRPISRAGFVVAYWLGFCTLAFMLIIPVVLCLGVLLPIDSQGAFVWSVSMILEALIVIAFALFASLILKSAVSSVLLCFGFYIVSRMMGFFLYVLEGPSSSGTSYFGIAAEKILLLVSMIMPRLDQYGLSEWLIYGINEQNISTISLVLIQSLIILPLLLSCAVYDFKRKQF